MKLHHGRLACVAVLAAILFFTVSPVGASPTETTDLVAFYAHLPVSFPGVTGPFTTVFFVSNTTSLTITVNIKCYSDVAGVRVGPAGGTNLVLSPFEVNFRTPVSLGLTSDPDFTGQGWCYFARSVGVEDFAVAFAMGIQGNNPLLFVVHPLFGSNASMAIGGGTAQAHVTDDDANVPLWLGSNWTTFLVIVNPTAASFGTLNVDVYNTSGTLIGSPASVIQARDLDLFVLSNFGGLQGNADLSRSTGSARGYMGWVYAINGTSFEAFLYEVPQDKDDSTTLDAGDRP